MTVFVHFVYSDCNFTFVYWYYLFSSSYFITILVIYLVLYVIPLKMSQCVKCNETVTTDIFECSTCSGIFHNDCVTQRTVHVMGRTIQGCLRCARDEERRKLSQNNASNPPASQLSGTSTQISQNISQYFVCPSILQTETIVNLSPKTTPKNVANNGDLASILQTLTD